MFGRRLLPEICLNRVPQPAAGPSDGREQQRSAHSDHQKNDFSSVAADLPEGGKLRDTARKLAPVGNRQKEQRKQEHCSDHQRGNQRWRLPVLKEGAVSTTRTRTLITVMEHRSLFLPPFYSPRLPGHENVCSDQDAARNTN